LSFGVNAAERMRIDSSGNVGVGTSSPASKFHISATGEARIILEGDSDNDSGEESSLLELRTDGGAVRHRVEATGSSGNDLKITAGADQTTNTLTSEIIFETKTANSATAERMRIDADGNVGIGVSSIVREPLQVHRASSSDVQIHMTNTSTGTSASDGMTIFANSTTSGFWQRESANMLFATNGTERMRIQPGGGILVGGTSTGGTVAAQIEANGGDSGRCFQSTVTGTGSANAITFNNGNGQVGRITTSGSATSFVGSSDYRMKENIVYDWNAMTKVKNLKPAQFNFKTNTDEIVEGFIAHEAQSVVPYAVVGEKDGEEMQGMDYGKLTAILTKAIQEQQEQIEAMKKEIEELKG